MNSRFIPLWFALYILCSTWPARADQPAYPELVLDDIKYVVSAPARWSDDEWHRAGWMSLGILGTAIIVDKPLQDEMHRHTPNNSPFMTQVERFGAQYAVGVVGGFYVAGLAGNDTAAQVAQDGLAASLIASGLITPSIKLLAGRSRPRAHAGVANFQPFSDANASFPSGHTTEAFTLASVIAEHYDQRCIQYGAYTVAGLVGLARSYHDAHFASDIVAGAIIGTLVGQSVVAHNRALRSTKVALLPDLAQGRIGMRLAGYF